MYVNICLIIITLPTGLPLNGVGNVAERTCDSTGDDTLLTGDVGNTAIRRERRRNFHLFL
jgi:hypothetical protein